MMGAACGVLLSVGLLLGVNNGRPGPDKVMHYGAGALAGAAMLSAQAMQKEKGPAWFDLAAPLVAGAVVGLGKEAYDKANGKPFDWQDLGSTAAGSVPMACLTLRW